MYVTEQLLVSSSPVNYDTEQLLAFSTVDYVTEQLLASAPVNYVTEQLLASAPVNYVTEQANDHGDKVREAIKKILYNSIILSTI